MNAPYEEMPTFEHEVSMQMADERIEPFDFRKNDIFGTMISHVPVLVANARNAVSAPGYAHSWRGFWVAASGIAYDTNPDEPRIGTYTSGNFKIRLDEEDRGEEDVEDVPKNCAEMDIAIRAGHDDQERIGLVVVAATTVTPRIEEVTGIATPTLWPCVSCNEMMTESYLFDSRTIIMTIGSGNNIFQVQSAGDLRKRHQQIANGESPKPLETHRYSEHAWDAKRAFYKEELRLRRLRADVYDPNKKRLNKCAELALEAMQE